MQKVGDRLSKYDIVNKVFDAIGEIARKSDFISAGLKDQDVYALCKQGYLERVKKGYYKLAVGDEPKEELILSKLMTHGVICVESALFYYGYSDFAPREWSIAVPRSYSRTVKAIQAEVPVKAYYVQNPMYHLGETTGTFNGVMLPVYDRERTVCDCFKYRTKLDNEIFNKAVNAYVADEKKNLANLSKYAKEMGVPIKKLICASNSNNVLTDFLKSGTYNKNRDFYCTASPSMDILISSNLERLLFILSGYDAEKTAEYMRELSVDGKYSVDSDLYKKISDLFDAGYCDDNATKATINEIFKKYDYLCDTHTAVAVNVYEEYTKRTGDDTPTVIASTANPYKFSASVLSAITDDIKSEDEFSMVEELFEKSKEPVPPQLATLKGKAPRFTRVSDKEDMAQVVFDMLGI